MTTITPTDTAVQAQFDDAGFDEAQLAAASFLARHSGARSRRTATTCAVHANDLWIAASAVHIGAPLLTADAVFDDVPGLSLH